MKNFGVKSNAAEVVFEHVTKIYGEQSVAVNDISFHVKAGELVTLLGPSGCGKTTTLRMIAGLEAVSKGDIIIGGRMLPTIQPQIATCLWCFSLMPYSP